MPENIPSDPNVFAPATPFEKGLGRVPAVDDRDRRFQLARVATTGRTSRTWFVPKPVLDQGATPSCVGHAGSKWLSAGPVTNAFIDPFALYGEAQRLDEWPGEDYAGTSVRGLMKALRARGLITEFNWVWSAGQVLDYVIEIGPMVLGLDWTAGMFRPDAKTGYISANGSFEGGHCVVAVGASRTRKNPDGSKGAVRILNSWGFAWGQNGRCWLSVDDLDRLMTRAPSGYPGEAATAAELRVR